MAWLDIFKSKKKCECFVCGSMNHRKESVAIKYRYGNGKGKIGTAYMCETCNERYNPTKEDEDYVEPV